MSVPVIPAQSQPTAAVPPAAPETPGRLICACGGACLECAGAWLARAAVSPFPSHAWRDVALLTVLAVIVGLFPVLLPGSEHRHLSHHSDYFRHPRSLRRVCGAFCRQSSRPSPRVSCRMPRQAVVSIRCIIPAVSPSGGRRRRQRACCMFFWNMLVSAERLPCRRDTRMACLPGSDRLLPVAFLLSAIIYDNSDKHVFYQAARTLSGMTIFAGCCRARF